MKDFLKILGLVAAIIFVSATLAPLLYDFLPALGGSVDRLINRALVSCHDLMPSLPHALSFKFEKIFSFKFERIFNRLVMMLTLIAVVSCVRFRRDTFTKYGLAWQRDSGTMFLKTFCLGFVMLSGLCAVYVAMGHAVWHPAKLGAGGWAGRIAGALATGLAVGVLEEFFFRGFCFRALLNRLGGPLSGKPAAPWAVWAALLSVSLFYALVHPVSHQKPLIGPHPGVMDSLKLAAAPFVAGVRWETFWPQVFGLFFFGVILNRLVVKTNSLYPAIGLHAGCVFYIKMNGALVDVLSNQKLVFGTSKLYDGLTGWAVLALIWFLSERLLGGARECESKTAPLS